MMEASTFEELAEKLRTFRWEELLSNGDASRLSIEVFRDAADAD